MLLGLGMDCGVYFMQWNTTTMPSLVKTTKKRKEGRPAKTKQPTCMFNGVDEGTWCIGRVQKIRCKVAEVPNLFCNDKPQNFVILMN